MDMNTINDNVFQVVAKALAESKLNEMYMTAGLAFEMLNPTSEVRRVFEVANLIYGEDQTASSAIVKHFNFLTNYHTEVQTSHFAFKQDASGHIKVGDLVIHFKITKICDEPMMYGALFTKLDSLSLVTSTNDRLNCLEDRIKALESLKNPG